jgi:hypothetical protein
MKIEKYKKLNDSVEKEVKSAKCLRCMRNPRTMLMANCCHLAVCEDCSKKLERVENKFKCAVADCQILSFYMIPVNFV